MYNKSLNTNFIVFYFKILTHDLRGELKYKIREQTDTEMHWWKFNGGATLARKRRSYEPSCESTHRAQNIQLEWQKLFVPAVVRVTFP